LAEEYEAEEWGEDHTLKLFPCFSFPCLFRGGPRKKRRAKNEGHKNSGFYIFAPIFLT
jgi:hypothetical protein